MIGLLPMLLQGFHTQGAKESDLPSTSLSPAQIKVLNSHRSHVKYLNGSHWANRIQVPSKPSVQDAVMVLHQC